VMEREGVQEARREMRAADDVDRAIEALHALQGSRERTARDNDMTKDQMEGTVSRQRPVN
jgi:hypothetical protein